MRINNERILEAVLEAEWRNERIRKRKIEAERPNNRHPDRWNSVRIPERVALRALRNITEDANGCWISNYSMTSTGHPQITWGDRGSHYTASCKRAAWTAVNGQVPIGLTVHHTCENKRCVRPDHGRLVTNAEAARHPEQHKPGYCPKGHPDKFRVTQKDGRAYCGQCRRVRDQKWRTRRREDERTQ